LVSKSLHSVLALVFVLIWQLPGFVQFEHSFHSHERVSIDLDTTNIHSQSDENCQILHDQFFFDFTFEVPVFSFSLKTMASARLVSLVKQFSSQVYLFSRLRAPPV